MYDFPSTKLKKIRIGEGWGRLGYTECEYSNHFGYWHLHNISRKTLPNCAMYLA